MKRFFQYALSLFLFCQPLLLLAQDNQATAQEALNSSAKLYVVLAVTLTITIGLIAFLGYQEKRISKIEQEVKKEK